MLVNFILSGKHIANRTCVQSRIIILSKVQVTGTKTFSNDVNSIKELRTRTQAGYTDCKRALTESNGDIQKAIDWLRKKGALKAAAKTNRVTAEGLVGLSVKNNVAVLVELNSESDFVARGESFVNLVKQITKVAVNTAKPVPFKATEISLDHFKQAPLSNGTVNDALTDAIAKLGENIKLRRAVQMGVTEGQGIIGSCI